MNLEALAPLSILFSSLIPGVVIFFLSEDRIRLRTTLNMAGAIIKILVVGFMLRGVYQGQQFEVRFPFLPETDLILRVDSLSLLFLTLSASLWLVTTIYAVGYLEDSPNRSRFFGFYSLCVSATVGIAMAGNLVTLFVFYEMLTLTTYPLVVHRGTEAARAAGRTYLAFTMSGGTVLLAGIVWLHALAGPIEFGNWAGALADIGEGHDAALITIFVLLASGFGVKAALVPLHQWLPRAMIAPAPVSALLHAVAVVKAGAFGIVRLVYDVYGTALGHRLGVTTGLALIAGFTILYGSLKALGEDDLKRRLAYSTVSQISYIILGVSLFSPLAGVGGLAHLVHQGLMKITLFFCAGNLAETLGVHKVSELDGAAHRMPWTMAAFTIAAFGMIGLPPFAGFISKWYLGVGAADAGAFWALAVLIASSLLNAAYFLPIVYRAWFRRPAAPWPDERQFGRYETKLSLLLPPLVTAAATILVGLLAVSSLSPFGWIRDVVTTDFPL